MKSKDHLAGLKSYLPGKPIEEVAAEFGITEIIKMASNENPLGPSPLALEAIRAELNRINLYPQSSAPDLKKALAQKWGLSGENIVIGNGSDEVMLLAALAYLEPGDEVITRKNTFSIYEFVSRVCGANFSDVHMQNYLYDLDAILKFITPKTRLIFLANPNSPTGTIITASALDRFLNQLPADTLLVLDEAYAEFVENPDFPKSVDYIKSGKNLLVLRTFSKLYGLAGVRVGYGLAKKEIASNLNRVRLPFSVNRLAQVAATAALEDAEFVEKTLKNNREGKAYLCQELNRLKLKYINTEANFICINVKSDADRLADKMLRQGVIVRTLSSFGLPEYIRVTIGTPEQNERFIKALKEVL